MKFKKTIVELKDLVARAGVDGKWEEGADGKHTCRTADGGVISWWSGTGSLLVQGDKDAKPGIEAKLAGVLGGGASPAPSPTAGVGATISTSAHIFVVHGHDHTAREQLELVLHRLGLNPFVLMNTSSAGLTIIEALEAQIGKKPSSDFGIVLMTPDDMGYAIKDGDKETKARARQNVVLETGMLLSSLTRQRVALLVKGAIEMPSDLQGVLYIAFNHHVKETVLKLAPHLQKAGFNISSAQIAAASA